MAQVKYPFNGQLNPNEIFNAIYNMIISQSVAYPELASNYAFADKFRVDGTLYGDTKLYYDSDVLSSRPWLNDSEASNLLAVNRPDAPKCQAITLDKFRQIDITVGNYLEKRAWSTEGAFSQFNSVIEGMLGETKKLYENTMFNVYVGTTEGAATRSTIEIGLTTALSGLTGEEKNRVEAQTIAQALADLRVDMKDYSRDFNDYGFMRAYEDGQLMFIVNSKWANKITKLDLPTVFHKEGLDLSENILPARYFGSIVDDVTAATLTDYFTASNNVYTVKTGVKTVRALDEMDVTNGTSAQDKHLFAGDIIPAGYIVKNATINLSGKVYIEKDDIICKIVTKDTYKYMSAFETSTEFFNARSLTSNKYLTWGFSAPDRLKAQPLVTVFAD